MIIAAIVALMLFRAALWFSPESFFSDHPFSDSHSYNERREENREFLGLTAEAWTAIFTAILTGSTLLLWDATRRADKTNGATARAALKAADVAERSLTDLEGPFLFPVVLGNDISTVFKPLKRYSHPTSPHNPVRPSIEFTIKNYGRTPALPQTVSAVFFLGNPQDRIDDHTPASGFFIAEALIGPGESVSAPLKRNMHNTVDGWDDYRDLMSGTVRIFLRGHIIFSDIFGNRYGQTFCLSWTPIQDGFMAWNPQMNRRERLHREEGGDGLSDEDGAQ